MFNIFSSSMAPNNNVYPTWTWSTGIKDADGKDISVENLIQKYNDLLKENKDYSDLLKSIEEDGTVEHNNAIKLREENVKLKEQILDVKTVCDNLFKVRDELKEEIEKWKEGVTAWRTQYDQEVAKNTKLEDEILEYKKGNKNWMNLYQEVVDKNNELLKEVNGLRHLKKENIELMERVNEIDSDMNKECRAEIFTLKNDIVVLKNKNTELLEKYNGFVTMGGLKYMEAKLQIVQNNYKKCSVERDEYKHQLNAANKEIEALKSRVRDWEDKYAKCFSYEDMYKLEKEIDQLKRWKKEQLTVQSWWDKVDSYVRDHDDAPLGGFVANTCLNFLKERDELKAEVKKLKDDIIDYVIEKDDELKKAQDWNNLNINYYQCNHCGYKIAHNTNQWGGCACCKDGLMIEKTEEQKHPMYPIHWGGWDKQTTAENLEKKFDNGEDVLDYFNKIEVTTSSTDKWQCPCNKCKDKREGNEKTWEEAASDLALKIVKLEKQIEELKIVNICQKQS